MNASDVSGRCDAMRCDARPKSCYLNSKTTPKPKPTRRTTMMMLMTTTQEKEGRRLDYNGERKREGSCLKEAMREFKWNGMKKALHSARCKTETR